MAHFNNPRMNDENNVGKVRRWVHQKLSIEHFGIHASIHENGKVSISKVSDEQPDKDEVQYDELEVPASLIFKLASLLKDTRSLQYVSLSEVKENETAETEEV